MKKLYLVFLFLVFSTILPAQNYELSGQIKDAVNKESLPYCHILALNNADSLIAATISDSKGYFLLQILQDNYLLVFDYVAYQKDTLKVKLDDDIFVGVIKLQPTNNQIGEVTVKASARKMEIDKESIVVTNEMRVNTTTTKDLLGKLNGLTYDHFKNQIKIDGSSHIIFLINGMEKDQNYIQHINPKRIKKVEIIRSPGGRYGTKGYDAIINLILKENYSGIDYQGDADIIIPTENDGSGLWNDNKIWHSSGNLTITHDKLNFYAQYYDEFLKINKKNTTTQDYSDYKYIENYQSDKINNLSSLYSYYTFGVDYSPTYNTTLSYEGDFTYLPQKYNHQEQNYNRELWQKKILQNSEAINYTNSSQSYYLYHSVYFKHQFNQKNDINADFHYYSYHSDYNNALNSALQTLEKGTDDKKSYKFYIEFNHSFNGKLSLNSGIGNSYQNLENKLNSVQNNKQEYQNYLYQNLRNNFYNYLKWKINENVGIKIGIALENWQQSSELVQQHYFIYQPYLDFKYSPASFLSLKLKYRSWSDYPSIDQNNPFVSYNSDNNSFSYGNPKLQPATTQKISLQTNVLGGLVLLEPYYYFSKNYISPTAMLTDSGYIAYSFDNVGNYNKSGVKLDFVIPFGKQIMMQNSVNFYYNKIAYLTQVNDFTDWTANIQLVYMNQKKALTIGAIYQKNISKQISAFGYTSADNDYWAMMLQKFFFRQRLSLSCIYILPINWGVSYNQTVYNKVYDYTEIQITDMSLLKNTFAIQISFNLSKGKVKNVAKDSKDEQDVKINSLF